MKNSNRAKLRTNGIRGPDLVLWLGLALFVVLGSGPALAGNIDPNSDGSGFAYGENVGWINLKPSFGPGVTVSPTAVTGFAWGENVGWINFSGVSIDAAGAFKGAAC